MHLRAISRRSTQMNVYILLMNSKSCTCNTPLTACASIFILYIFSHVTRGTSLFVYKTWILTISCKFFDVKGDDGFSIRLKPIHTLYLIATYQLHEILQAVR